MIDGSHRGGKAAPRTKEQDEYQRLTLLCSEQAFEIAQKNALIEKFKERLGAVDRVLAARDGHGTVVRSVPQLINADRLATDGKHPRLDDGPTVGQTLLALAAGFTVVLLCGMAAIQVW